MVLLTSTYLLRKMMDRLSVYLTKAPDVEVVVTAPCVYILEGCLLIDLNEEGTSVNGYPLHTIESFHITKEYSL